MQRRLLFLCSWRICDGKPVRVDDQVNNVIIYVTYLHVEILCSHRCHLGKSIIYDTISNLSWPSDVRSHTIQTVIQRLLSEPWPPALEVGREVPEAIAEEDCVVSLLLDLCKHAIRCLNLRLC